MSTQVRDPDGMESLGRRWLGVLAGAVGILTVALAALFTHFAADLIASMDCGGFYDTGPPPPAVASPQGQMCGQYPSTLGEVIWDGGFLLSAILTVALIVVAWERGPWIVRVASLALLMLMPIGTAWLLGLPSDDCSAKARSSHPTWQCSHGY